LRLPIVDFRLPIGFWPNPQSAVGNWQLAIGWPTRYRVVVLTSWDRTLDVCNAQTA